MTISIKVGWLLPAIWMALSGDLLSAVEEESGPGFRSVALTVHSIGKTGFIQLSPQDTGITFTNRLPLDRYLTNQIYLNGSGVTVGDVDGDGRCDVYFCSLGGTNILYRNLGNWKFEDVTAASGVACPNFDSTGAA